MIINSCDGRPHEPYHLLTAAVAAFVSRLQPMCCFMLHHCHTLQHSVLNILSIFTGWRLSMACR